MITKTLSIIQIKDELQAIISDFVGLKCYKVEVGFWSFNSSPQLQLYVCCEIYQEQHRIQTQAQSLPKALQEIKDWYASIAPPTLVADIDTTEPEYELPL